jgi:hypothetical protein
MYKYNIILYKKNLFVIEIFLSFYYKYKYTFIPEIDYCSYLINSFHLLFLKWQGMSKDQKML